MILLPAWVTAFAPASHVQRVREIARRFRVAIALGTFGAASVAGAQSAANVPVVTSAAAVTATAGAPFTYAITAEHAPAGFAATGLPPGLTLDRATGVISGRPRYPLDYSVPVFATNASGTGCAILNLRVQPPSAAPCIVSPDRDTAVKGVAYAYAIGCINPATTFEAVGLPGGLTLSGDRIRGTPTTPGTFRVFLRASNASGVGTDTLTLTVLDADAVTGPPAAITQVIAPRDGNYFGSLALSFTVWFNAPVVVTGFPRLPVTIGSTVRYAVWDGPPLDGPAGSQRALTFQLSLAAEDSDSDGIALASALDLNGGTLRDLAGNPVSLALTPPDTRGVCVGAWPSPPPRIVSVSTDTDDPTDHVTTDHTVVLHGIAGTTSVALFRSDVGFIGTALAGETGEWSFDYTATTLPAGRYTFTAMNRRADAPLYSPPSAPFTVTVKGDPVATVRAAQTITWGETPARTFGEAPFDVSARSSTGLPVTLRIASGPATLAGSRVTLTGAGEVVLEASQPGNTQVLPVTASVRFVVNKATPSIALGHLVQTADGAPKFATVTTSPLGLPVALSYAGGSVAPAAPGTYPVVATVNTETYAGTASGTLVINARATPPPATPASPAPTAGSETSHAVPEVTRTPATSPRENPVAARLVNLSARLRIAGGEANRSVIAGFVVSGTSPRAMLVRAVGPGLGRFGVRDALPNPRLEIFDAAGKLVVENDDWGDNAAVGATAERVGAFPLAAGSRDAAVIATLSPGAYTAQVRANSDGVALVEVYDAADGTGAVTQRLANLSTRGLVESGEGVLVGGFVVNGNAPRRLLIRGIGPALAGFGVAGALTDPRLKIYEGETLVAQNDDWSSPQPANGAEAGASGAEISAAAINAGAFALPSGSADAAILITLMPGTYSAIVSGAGNSIGVGLVEVYDVSGL